MLNALLYTFILYHILFLLICDAFMCVHCIVFYSSATEALINNNNNNNNSTGILRSKRAVHETNCNRFFNGFWSINVSPITY